MLTLIPFAFADSVKEISIEFYKKYTINYIFLDLDNTLDSPHTKMPSVDVINLIRTFKNNNIEPIIISNNTYNRVYLYTKDLDVKFLSRTYKPFTHKFKKFLKVNNINKDNSILIGDQIFSDIKLAYKMNIKSILVNRISKKEQLITFFPRMFDKMYRKKLFDKKLIKK